MAIFFSFLRKTFQMAKNFWVAMLPCYQFFFLCCHLTTSSGHHDYKNHCHVLRAIMIGSCLGARLGVEGIPMEWIEKVAQKVKRAG